MRVLSYLLRILIVISMLTAFFTGCAKKEEPRIELVEAKFDPWLVMGHDLKITFSLPMKRKDESGKEIFPKIIFNPPLEGSFKWEGAQELLFTPAEGSLTRGERFDIKIVEAMPLKGEQYALREQVIGYFIARYFEMAGKTASWPVVEGKPRFVDYLGWHTGEIGHGPLYLLYDQPVSIKQIEGKVRAYHVEQRELPFELYKPAAEEIQVGYIVNSDHVVALKLKELPPMDEDIVVYAPDWDSAADKDSTELEFRVNSEFTLTRDYSSEWGEGYGPSGYYDEYYGGYNEEEYGYGEGGGGPEQDENLFYKRFYLSFNNYFDVEQLKELIIIEPEPVSFDVQGYSYLDVTIKVVTTPGARHVISFGDGELKDYLGNSLNAHYEGAGGPIFAYDIQAPDLPPEFVVNSGHMVFEKERAEIRFKGINVGDFVTRTIKYETASAYIKALYNFDRGKQGLLKEGLTGAERSFNAEMDGFALNQPFNGHVNLGKESGFKLFTITGRSKSSVEDITGGQRFEEQRLIHQTDVAVTARIAGGKLTAWVTSLSKPAPLEGALVRVYDEKGELLEYEGKTDSSGLLTLETNELFGWNSFSNAYYVAAEYSGDTGLTRLVNSELSSPWQFNLPGVVKDYESDDFGKSLVSIFSDRGVYRPGESCRLKIIANRDFAPPNIFEGSSVSLLIKDSRGQTVAEEDLVVDEFGTANYEFAIKKQASVGRYSVYVIPHLGGPAPTKTYSFLVEEYRVPNFQVNVSSNQPNWSEEGRIFTRVMARYFKGDALDGRAVNWKVYRQRANFQVKSLPGYIFHLEEREDKYSGLVTGGEGKLDKQGELAVDFNIDHPQAAGMMRYIVQATVTDLDRQAYSGAISRLVHPSDYYVGVKPPSKNILSSGESFIIPYVAVDHQGNPIAGKDISVEIEQIAFHSSVKMDRYGNSTTVEHREEYHQGGPINLKSGKSPQNFELKIDAAGLYRISFSGISGGPDVTSGFILTVTGDEPTAWPRFDKDQIALISDKDSYVDGETVKLVVQSPYKNALALLTVERDGIYHQELFRIKGDTPSIEFPVKGEYAPNVYASVVLVRGREHNEEDATGFETGAPGFKIGYLNIPVDPAEQRLTVKVAPDREQIIPGQKMTVTVEAKDHKGNPVEGQATLYVVDDAVLSLTGYRTPDPLREIYSDFPLDSRVASNLLDLPFSRRYRYEDLFPAGGEDGAGFFEPEKVLRNLFQSTAYWNPDLRLDSEGKASVDIMMPDNITSYRIMAVVNDKESRLGSAQNRVVSKKPLMIQPVLPRFVYPGDRLEIEARVFNQTGISGDVELSAEFSGLNITYGELNSKLKVIHGGSELFPFKVKVDSTGTTPFATVLFRARLGEHEDLVEYKIPIISPSLEQTQVTNRFFMGGKVNELVMDIPEDFLEGTLQAEVVVSGTVLSELKDGVEYVMDYPHGCIEQTTSTAFPLIILEDLLPDVGIEVDREDLRKFSTAGVERIQTFLTSSGGLSYWPGDYEPHAFGTGFGAMALVEAKKRGYDVPQESLNRLADYMQKKLRQSSIKSSMSSYHDANGDILALYALVLGRMGRPQIGYIERLWSNKGQLSTFGMALLAMGLHEQGGNRSVIDAIIGELKFRAKINDDEASFGSVESSSWSLNSPVRAHAAVLSAFAVTGADDDIAYKLVKGLLNRRGYNGLWGNTQETVFGVMGFYEFARSKAGGEAPNVTLSLNGKELKLSDMEKLSGRSYRIKLTEEQVKSGGKKIVLKVDNRGGSGLNSTVRVKYDLPLKEKYMTASTRGLSIEHSYETAAGKKLKPDEIPLGTLLRVRVKVKLAQDINYCAIDDKLPAGLEPLNTNLKTTEQVGKEGLSELAKKTLELISYSEVRDSRVLFYADVLKAGEYEFTYMARATTKGIFLRPAAKGEAMYDPDIVGKSEIDYVKVVSAR